MNKLFKKSYKVSPSLLFLLLALPLITFFLGNKFIARNNDEANTSTKANVIRTQREGTFKFDGYSFKIPTMFKVCEWNKNAIVVSKNDTTYCEQSKFGTDVPPKIVISTIEGDLANRAFSNLKDKGWRGVQTVNDINVAGEPGIEVKIDRSNEQDQGPRRIRIIRIGHQGTTYELVQNDFSAEVQNAFDSIFQSFNFEK